MTDLAELVRAHEVWRASTINLQPSENVMSDQARRLLASDFGHRYTLSEYTDPQSGESTNAYRGTRYVDAVEDLAESLAREVFGAAHASLKPLSGHVAGSLLVQTVCRRGDLLMTLDAAHGGYDGYMPANLSGLLGLQVDFLPFDTSRWNLDERAAADAILERRPRLVLVGASFILFPYNLRWLRGACDDVNAVLGYDASHVLGLLAGGEFQSPMTEGVDVLSGSTHKSFPGPQGGLFVTNRRDLHERVVPTLLWRLQDNAHWHRIAATAQVLLEMRAFGAAYAKQVVANAKALAHQLDRWGFPLRFAALGYTESPQLLYDGAALREKWDLTVAAFADRLEANDIIVDAVARLGTSEITRMGATEEHMAILAGLIVRAAQGEDVRGEVGELRSRLHLSFAFPP